MIAPLLQPGDQVHQAARGGHRLALRPARPPTPASGSTLFPSSAISVDKAGARPPARGLGGAGGRDQLRARGGRACSLTSARHRAEEDEDDNTCQKLDRARAVDGAPITVDATPIPGRGVGEFSKGHQFMPSITFSQGKLMLVYYDTRLDHTRAYFNPNKPFDADAQGSFYEVIRGPLGAPAVSDKNIPIGPDNQLDPTTPSSTPSWTTGTSPRSATRWTCGWPRRSPPTPPPSTRRSSPSSPSAREGTRPTWRTPAATWPSRASARTSRSSPTRRSSSSSSSR